MAGRESKRDIGIWASSPVPNGPIVTYIWVNSFPTDICHFFLPTELQEHYRYEKAGDEVASSIALRWKLYGWSSRCKREPLCKIFESNCGQSSAESGRTHQCGSMLRMRGERRRLKIAADALRIATSLGECARELRNPVGGEKRRAWLVLHTRGRAHWLDDPAVIYWCRCPKVLNGSGIQVFAAVSKGTRCCLLTRGVCCMSRYYLGHIVWLEGCSGVSTADMGIFPLKGLAVHGWATPLNKRSAQESHVNATIQTRMLELGGTKTP